MSDLPVHPREEPVVLEFPNETGSHAIVRASITATCRAWSVDEEVTDICRIVVSELLAWGLGDRMSVELSIADADTGMLLSISPAGIPAEVDDAERMRVDLVRALVGSLRQQERSVTVAIPFTD